MRRAFGDAAKGLLEHARSGGITGDDLGGTLEGDGLGLVAELVAEVIEWNANPDYALSAEAMRDPRVRVVHADVVRVLAERPAAFDAIMLDTDNGPDGMIMAENARLYATRGIARTVAALEARVGVADPAGMPR